MVQKLPNFWLTLIITLPASTLFLYILGAYYLIEMTDLEFEQGDNLASFYVSR